MPLERLQALVGMPNVIPNIADAREQLFERSFLKSTIGGAIQALIVRFVSISTFSQCSTEGAQSYCQPDAPSRISTNNIVLMPGFGP